LAWNNFITPKSILQRQLKRFSNNRLLPKSTTEHDSRLKGYILSFIEAGLLFCLVICYIITLVVMMQLHSRFGKMIDDREAGE